MTATGPLRQNLSSDAARAPAAEQLLAAAAAPWMDHPAADPRPAGSAQAQPEASPAPPAPDALSAALPWLVRHLGVGAAVEAALGPEDGAAMLDADRLLPLLKRLGYALRADRRSLAELSATDCPLLLQLRSGDSCVLLGCDGAPGAARRWQVVVPAEPPLTFSVSEAELEAQRVGLGVAMQRTLPARPRSDLRARADSQAARSAPDARPALVLASAQALRESARTAQGSAHPIAPAAHRSALDDALLRSGPGPLDRALQALQALRHLHPLRRIGTLAATLRVRRPATQRTAQRAEAAAPIRRDGLGQRLAAWWSQWRPRAKGRDGKGGRGARRPPVPERIEPRFENRAAATAALPADFDSGIAVLRRSPATPRGWRRLTPKVIGAALQRWSPDSDAVERWLRRPLLALGLLCSLLLGLPAPRWAPLFGDLLLQALGNKLPGLARSAYAAEYTQIERQLRLERRRAERARREREQRLLERERAAVVARSRALVERLNASMQPFAPSLPPPGGSPLQALVSRVQG